MDAAKPHAVGRRRYTMLALMLAAVIVIVAAITMLSRERIAANERAWFLDRLAHLVPATMHDNDLFEDQIVVRAPDLLGVDGPTPIYRARKNGQPTAMIMSVTAREGYGGEIDLLIAMDYEGKLLGVDVLHHNETQGIGDGFAPHRSNWLQLLKGRALGNPAGRRWTIRKDGGEFEQFTGASVTPRAILKAIRLALEYYQAHRETLFNAPPTQHF
jgi:electron transport complex protein RnfG